MENNEFINEEPLELRMYFFTIYQLTGIQKGIQAGHAALEYAQKYRDDEEYQDFIQNYKTWVILNGGTTNDERDFDEIPTGTLNQIADKLYENEVKFSYFREPDLNNSLTAICFILDERVFNRKKYPDFIDYLINNYRVGASEQEIAELKKTSHEILIKNPHYKEWVRSLGGLKNVFLRELINGKKLA